MTLKVTSGSYPTEADSKAEFVRIIGASGLFRIYAEVEGYYIAHRPGRELKCPRIDYILQPLPKLRTCWTATIGIEVKRSGSKLGPLVNQAIDYSWAIFRCGDTYLYPEAIFIWPLRKDGIADEKIYNAIESVMVGNRIGYCSTSDGAQVDFHYGAGTVLTVNADGQANARSDLFAPVGLKQGSR